MLADRVPPRYRPTLFLESLYSIGTGAFVSLFLLSTVVLKTILNGSEQHLALLAAMFGGSSLCSPLVGWLSRTVPMKSLVVWPNLACAALLLTTAFTGGSPWLFAVVIGLCFVIRVFPRVGEMNLYRVLYPVSHRGSAIGWVRMVWSVSAAVITLTGYCWFSFFPEAWWGLYVLVALLLVSSSYCYSRIPVSRRSVFARQDGLPPHRAFARGVQLFLTDRRFVLYQFGFALAGFANHMAHAYVAQVLTDDVIGQRDLARVLPGTLYEFLSGPLGLERQTIIGLTVGLVVAVLPVLLVTASSLYWGRLLDRINPMSARALFNTIQAVAYALHAYGGLTMQVWPMLLGSMVHAIGNGGGTINWLTGSLYFARDDQVGLYNAVHVGLTGLRGLIAPVCGFYLYSQTGLGLGAQLFAATAVLSVAGAAVMLWQGLTDPGPREERVPAAAREQNSRPAQPATAGR